MIRLVLSFLAVSIFVGVVAGSGCQVSGIGDPCTPDEEYVSNFAGFDIGEVNVESKSFQCRTRLCLANHFQGRVSCPYGQDSSGAAPMGISMTDPNANGCVVPGTTIPIDPTCGVAVTTPGAGCPMALTPPPRPARRSSRSASAARRRTRSTARAAARTSTAPPTTAQTTALAPTATPASRRTARRSCRRSAQATRGSPASIATRTTPSTTRAPTACRVIR